VFKMQPIDQMQRNRTGACGRREFLRFGVTALVLGSGVGKTLADTSSPPATGPTVLIENFSAAGKSLGIARAPKRVKTDEEWRRQLSPLAYEVTRRSGTERSYSGRYASSEADGLYRCICCDTALYDSRAKYESGTGWPSFWQPISALNIVKIPDYSMFVEVTAISCRLCDAHLGHVFDDGPRPTGLRYCMNSVALNFVARV
jgi:peptide-methionine (R)-S-oxide reductase